MTTRNRCTWSTDQERELVVLVSKYGGNRSVDWGALYSDRSELLQCFEQKQLKTKWGNMKTRCNFEQLLPDMVPKIEGKDGTAAENVSEESSSKRNVGETKETSAPPKRRKRVGSKHRGKARSRKKKSSRFFPSEAPNSKRQKLSSQPAQFEDSMKSSTTGSSQEPLKVKKEFDGFSGSSTQSKQTDIELQNTQLHQANPRSDQLQPRHLTVSKQDTILSDAKSNSSTTVLPTSPLSISSSPNSKSTSPSEHSVSASYSVSALSLIPHSSTSASSSIHTASSAPKSLQSTSPSAPKPSISTSPSVSLTPSTPFSIAPTSTTSVPPIRMQTSVSTSSLSIPPSVSTSASSSTSPLSSISTPSALHEQGHIHSNSLVDLLSIPIIYVSSPHPTEAADLNSSESGSVKDAPSGTVPTAPPNIQDSGIRDALDFLDKPELGSEDEKRQNTKPVADKVEEKKSGKRVLNYSEKGPHECLECGNLLNSWLEYGKHFRESHPTVKKPFGCRICGKSFAIYSSITRHLRQSAECGQAQSLSRKRVRSSVMQQDQNPLKFEKASKQEASESHSLNSNTSSESAKSTSSSSSSSSSKPRSSPSGVGSNSGSYSIFARNRKKKKFGDRSRTFGPRPNEIQPTPVLDEEMRKDLRRWFNSDHNIDQDRYLLPQAREDGAAKRWRRLFSDEPLTDLEKQISQLKKKYPGIVLVVQCGYQYRFFGEDAVIAARTSNIFYHPDGKFMRASIPIESLEYHLRNLVQSGYKVGVVDQLETAAIKKADKAPGIMKRDVSAIYTTAASCGTHLGGLLPFEHSGTSRRSFTRYHLKRRRQELPSRYILCLNERDTRISGSSSEASEPQKVLVSLIAFDATTGDFFWDEFVDGFMRTEISTRLVHFNPAEIILPEKLSRQTEKLLEQRNLITMDYTNRWPARAPPGTVRGERLPRKKFDHSNALELLCEFYGSSNINIEDDVDLTMLGELPLEKKEVGEHKHDFAPSSTSGSETQTESSGVVDCSLSDSKLPEVLELPEECQTLLGVLIEHFRGFMLYDVLKSVGNFRNFLRSTEMKISGDTLRNLNILECPVVGDAGTLLKHLDETVTRFGKRLFRKWITHPLAVRDLIIERLDAVEEIRDCTLGEGMRRHVRDSFWRDMFPRTLKNLPDLERGLTRIEYRTCNPKEFLVIMKGFKSLMDILPSRDLISDLKSTLLKKLFKRMPHISKDVDWFLNSLKKDKTDNLAEIFTIDHMFPKLLACQANVEDVEEKLKNILETYHKTLKKPGLRYRKIGNIEYLVEVSRTYVDLIPNSWSPINDTKVVIRYHTPEIKKILPVLNEKRERLMIEARKCWEWFLGKFKNECGPFRDVVEDVAVLDCLFGLAKVALRGTFVKPEITEKRQLCIKRGRNPIVETNVDQFIPNDIDLSPDGTLSMILTGPNMGGKSVYMRQIAYIVMMAQMGSFVPADEASLSVFDSVHARMGAYDDIFHGKSTFFVEMAETASIIGSITEQSLVIMDEFGRGTSSREGAIIAESTLEHLIGTAKCFTVFTTHFQTIATLEQKFPKVCRNFHMKYVEEPPKEEDGYPEVTFLYTIGPGICEKSYGINVARMAELPPQIWKRATKVAQWMKEKLDIERKKIERKKNTELGGDTLTEEIDELQEIFAFPKRIPLALSSDSADQMKDSPVDEEKILEFDTEKTSHQDSDEEDCVSDAEFVYQDDLPLEMIAKKVVTGIEPKVREALRRFLGGGQIIGLDPVDISDDDDDGERKESVVPQYVQRFNIKMLKFLAGDRDVFKKTRTLSPQTGTSPQPRIVLSSQTNPIKSPNRTPNSPNSPNHNSSQLPIHQQSNTPQQGQSLQQIPSSPGFTSQPLPNSQPVRDTKSETITSQYSFSSSQPSPRTSQSPPRTSQSPPRTSHSPLRTSQSQPHTAQSPHPTSQSTMPSSQSLFFSSPSSQPLLAHPNLPSSSRHQSQPQASRISQTPKSELLRSPGTLITPFGERISSQQLNSIASSKLTTNHPSIPNPSIPQPPALQQPIVSQGEHLTLLHPQSPISQSQFPQPQLLNSQSPPSISQSAHILKSVPSISQPMHFVSQHEVSVSQPVHSDIQSSSAISQISQPLLSQQFPISQTIGLRSTSQCTLQSVPQTSSISTKHLFPQNEKRDSSLSFTQQLQTPGSSTTAAVDTPVIATQLTSQSVPITSEVMSSISQPRPSHTSQPPSRQQQYASQTSDATQKRYSILPTTNTTTQSQTPPSPHSTPSTSQPATSSQRTSSIIQPSPLNSQSPFFSSQHPHQHPQSAPQTNAASPKNISTSVAATTKQSQPVSPSFRPTPSHSQPTPSSHRTSSISQPPPLNSQSPFFSSQHPHPHPQSAPQSSVASTMNLPTSIAATTKQSQYASSSFHPTPSHSQPTSSIPQPPYFISQPPSLISQSPFFSSQPPPRQPHVAPQISISTKSSLTQNKNRILTQVPTQLQTLTTSTTAKPQPDSQHQLVASSETPWNSSKGDPNSETPRCGTSPGTSVNNAASLPRPVSPSNRPRLSRGDRVLIKSNDKTAWLSKDYLCEAVVIDVPPKENSAAKHQSYNVLLGKSFLTVPAPSALRLALELLNAQFCLEGAKIGDEITIHEDHLKPEGK